MLVQDVVGLALGLSTRLQFSKVYLVRYSYTSRMRGRNPEISYTFLRKYADARNVEHETVDIDDLQNILEIEQGADHLFTQIGLLNSNLYKSFVYPREYFDKISIVSGMADLLLGLDKPFSNGFGILDWYEGRKWKSNLNSLPFDDIYFPALHKRAVTISNKPVIYIDKEVLRTEIEYAIASSNLPIWFSEMYDQSLKLIIINPYQTVSAHFLAKIHESMTKNSKFDKFSILVKPHPSTLNPKAICEQISKVLQKPIMNSTLEIDSEFLSEIPLEYFLVHFKILYVVGSPSSAFSLIDASQVQLLKRRSGFLLQDILERTNARPFLRLCVKFNQLNYQ